VAAAGTLQLSLTKLTSAESRLLKDELLLLVANALYYNAAATLTLLQQFRAVQQLFGLWFTGIFARRWGSRMLSSVTSPLMYPRQACWQSVY